MSATFRMPETLCPSCAAAVDGVYDVRATQRPKAGDLTVCVYCGEIETFTQELQLERLGAEGLASLTPSERLEILHAQRSVRRMLERHPGLQRPSPGARA